MGWFQGWMLFPYAYMCWLSVFTVIKYFDDHKDGDGEFVFWFIITSPLWIPLALPILALAFPFVIVDSHVPTPAERKKSEEEKKKLALELSKPPKDPLEEQFEGVKIKVNKKVKA